MFKITPPPILPPEMKSPTSKAMPINSRPESIERKSPPSAFVRDIITALTEEEIITVAIEPMPIAESGSSCMDITAPTKITDIAVTRSMIPAPIRALIKRLLLLFCVAGIETSEKIKNRQMTYTKVYSTVLYNITEREN